MTAEILHLVDEASAPATVCNVQGPRHTRMLVSDAGDDEGWTEGMALCLDCVLLVGPPPGDK